LGSNALEQKKSFKVKTKYHPKDYVINLCPLKSQKIVNTIFEIPDDFG
jgi:hypothetical protein